MTNTEGMLPEASIVFLDEIFNANSAILNSLLTALNERTFKRGKEFKNLPSLMFVAASNILPENEALAALFDRFLVRVKSEWVAPDRLNEVLQSGWNLERNIQSKIALIDVEDVKAMQAGVKNVVLDKVRPQFLELIYAMRNAGVKVSDRRAVKLQNLIAASAFLCERNEAVIADLWVLKHIWDAEDQIEILEAIVNDVIDKEHHPQAHAQAYKSKIPNIEQLMQELMELEQQWSNRETTLADRNLIKDKLRFLQNRGDWSKASEQKNYLQEKIDALWKKILEWL